jgi:hypothetical protein
VASNKGNLGVEWPVTVHGVKVSVADTRELDVDENLIWTGLWHWDILVDNLATTLLQHLGLLHLWDRHVVL